MEPEQAYEDIHVEERGSNKLRNVNITIWVILGISALIIIYAVQTGIGGADLKTYLPYIVVMIVIIILIVMNQKSGKVLMIRKEAEVLVYKELEDDEKIRKLYPRGLSTGKREIGMSRLIYNQTNEPLYWIIGFGIRGYMNSNYPKWFLAEVDPWRNGIGIIAIEKLESEYRGGIPNAKTI